MHTLDYLISRTDQKLRFARIHVDELRGHPSRNTGDDFERSHHESFLFHLYGAVDAFLQELNLYCNCGLALEKVSREALKKTLEKQGRISKILSELAAGEAVSGSALATAKQFRHYAMHRGGLPMQHYMNGPSNLVHPITRLELQADSISVFDSWLGQITTSLNNWRTNAQQGDA